MFRKHHLAILSFIMAFAGIAATDSVNGVHNASQAPTARTGAPGEQNCTSCHSGTVNSGGGSLSLTGLPANGYTPGQTYTLTVTVNDQSQPAATRKYGFSTTSLNSSNAMAGAFAVTNSSTTSTGNATVSGASRSYMRHKTASSSNTWSFNWTAPATNIGTVSFYIAGLAANGTGGDGGDKVYTTKVDVVAEVLAPTATFTTSATSICAGQNVTFTNTTTGTVTAYDWDFGNGSTATTAGPHTISYPQAGTYTALLTATNTAGFDTQTVKITVSPLPVPQIAFTPGTAPLLKATAGMAQYTWYLNGNAIPNSNDSSFQTAEMGTYKVCVTSAAGCNGCSDTVVIVWSGVVDNQMVAMTIAPNPATQSVRVSLPVRALRLELTDLSGKTLQVIAQPALQTELNLADLPAGAYWLRALLPNGRTATAQLLKQ